jgi:hypothetical protein
VEPDALDAIRERVRAAESLREYPVDRDAVVSIADRRALLRLIDSQQERLDRAHDFTENYERQLLKGLAGNTLDYFRRILSGHKSP